MKITEVTTYSVHTTQFRNFNFVRIDTDEGVHGVGELFCIGADKATAEMVKYVSEWVVGMDPLDRERIQKRILNYSRFPGGSTLLRRPAPTIWLLWDIAGKIANLPVYKMVGAVRDRVPVYCHTMGKEQQGRAGNVAAQDREVWLQGLQGRREGPRLLPQRFRRSTPRGDV